MECSYIPTIPYHKFSKRIHDKTASERIPLGGSLEPTLRCNLKCAHCYAACDHNKKEMVYKEICHILDEITEAQCLWLLITGGEPLLREDFLDIYAYAKRKGLLITLFTNGTLITPEIADYLKEWPPFSVEISLYGISKETYERVTGVPGSFEHCMRGISLLLERKVPFGLKTMVITLNQHELEALKKYAAKLGVRFRYDALINAGLDGSCSPCEFRITPEDVVRLDLTDVQRLKEWKEFCKKFLNAPKSNKLYICQAGKTGFHIDPYGKLNLCLMSRGPSLDLREGSFRQAWHEFMPEVLSQEPQGNYKCGRCSLIGLCGQCPALAYLENGNPEIPIEYFCQVAHLRAEAFGINKGNEQ
jgi:radical SAM protein with 4Fe4S-binding SPASM domain